VRRLTKKSFFFFFRKNKGRKGSCSGSVPIDGGYSVNVYVKKVLSLEFTIEILIFLKKISVDGGFMALYMGGIFSHMVRKLCSSLLAIAFYT
jgi:hypothetical protein